MALPLRAPRDGRDRWLLPLVIPLLVVALGPLGYSLVRHKSNLVDFEVYRTAAGRVVHGEPLYRESDGHYQFKYLPAFAIVMAPFAAVPKEPAEAAWYVICVGLLVLFVRESLVTLPNRSRSERSLVGLTILLMARCYVRELHFGQTNVLLGALLVLALHAILRGRPLVGGALAGLAVFVKPYAVIVIPWLAIAAGIGSAAACLGVVTGGLLLPIAAYGWMGNIHELQGWFHTVTRTTPENLLLPENVSFATMWAKWIGPTSAAAALATISSLLIVLLAAVVVARRRGVERPEYLELALLLLVVPLISPQGWEYVLMLGTPAVMCLVDRLPRMTLLWRGATLIALIVIGFTIYDVIGRVLYRKAMAASILTVAATVLAVALVNLRSRRLA